MSVSKCSQKSKKITILAPSIKLLIPLILLSPHLKLCLLSAQNQGKRLGDWLLF